MSKLYGDVKPGDRLFRAKRGHRQNDPLTTDWVVVTKVGRKWAEYMPDGHTSPHMAGRFYLTTGRCESSQMGWYIKRAFLSEDEWHAYVEDESAWDAWRRVGVTAQNIREAAALLGIKLEVAK